MEQYLAGINPRFSRLSCIPGNHRLKFDFTKLYRMPLCWSDLDRSNLG